MQWRQDGQDGPVWSCFQVDLGRTLAVKFDTLTSALLNLADALFRGELFDEEVDKGKGKAQKLVVLDLEVGDEEPRQP